MYDFGNKKNKRRVVVTGLVLVAAIIVTSILSAFILP